MIDCDLGNFRVQTRVVDSRGIEVVNIHPTDQPHYHEIFVENKGLVKRTAKVQGHLPDGKRLLAFRTEEDPASLVECWAKEIQLIGGDDRHPRVARCELVHQHRAWWYDVPIHCSKIWEIRRGSLPVDRSSEKLPLEIRVVIM